MTTNDMMTLQALLAKQPDADIVREMLGWLDATYLKVRQSNRVVSVAVVLAIGVNTDGRREVLGMDIGLSEAEVFWAEFLRELRRRVAGVKLVASDAHDGLKAAATKVPGATKQRLPRAFSPHPSSPGGKPGRRLVAAFIDTAFAQPDAASAKTQWRQVADHMRPKLPKLAVILDDAEEDVLAHMSFPKQRWTKLHLTNPRGCSVLEAIRCFHPHGACGGRKRVYPAGRERDSIRDIFSSEDVPHAPVSAFTFGATNRP